MMCVYVKSIFLLLKVDICGAHHAHCKYLDTLLIWGYMYICLDKQHFFFTVKSGLQIRVHIGKLFSSFLIDTYVVCTQMDRLNETVLLSTQNTCLD